MPETRSGRGKLDCDFVLGLYLLAETNHTNLCSFPANAVFESKDLPGPRLHCQHQKRSMRIYHQRVSVFRKRAPGFLVANHLYANARNNALASPSFGLKGRDLRFEHLAWR